MRQTYPGWNGTPGRETHPLQSCWIHNIKEEVGNKRVDPFYGKNVWPDEALTNPNPSPNPIPNPNLNPNPTPYASQMPSPPSPRTGSFLTTRLGLGLGLG